MQRFKVTRSYDFAYQCLTCDKKHKGENITIIIGDQFCPDTFSMMTDGTCACIIRFHGMTVMNLNFYVLGPLSAHGRNWEGLGNYGIGEITS